MAGMSVCRNLRQGEPPCRLVGLPAKGRVGGDNEGVGKPVRFDAFAVGGYADPVVEKDRFGSMRRGVEACLLSELTASCSQRILVRLDAASGRQPTLEPLVEDEDRCFPVAIEYPRRGDQLARRARSSGACIDQPFSDVPRIAPCAACRGDDRGVVAWQRGLIRHPHATARLRRGRAVRTSRATGGDPGVALIWSR